MQELFENGGYRNTTHLNLERPLGGGYDYEYLLGAEIALSALHPGFEVDWQCVEEETPIFLGLRQWVGRVVELTPDQRVKRDEQPVGEDINLVGSEDLRLHIQVKSGILSADDLRKVTRRFLKVFERDARMSKFLLIADGLPTGFGSCLTLSEANKKSSLG